MDSVPFPEPVSPEHRLGTRLPPRRAAVPLGGQSFGRRGRRHDPGHHEQCRFSLEATAFGYLLLDRPEEGGFWSRP